MLLVANFANTKWHRKLIYDWKPASYLMNTNMSLVGFLVVWQNVVLALEVLNGMCLIIVDTFLTLYILVALTVL